MAFKSRKSSCVCYLPTLILTNLHNKYIFNEIRLRSRSRGLEMSLAYLKTQTDFLVAFEGIKVEPWLWYSLPFHNMDCCLVLC